MSHPSRLVLLVTALAFQATGATLDWEHVRSVANRDRAGAVDLVLIPELRQRDTEYYVQVANVVCGAREQCMVFFWTDRAHIPTSINMPVANLAVATATYERYPTYNAPVLHLACRLYPNREVAEQAKCGYFPGAEVPWDMPKRAK